MCMICLSVSVLSSYIDAYWTDFPYIGYVYGGGSLTDFGDGVCWNSFSASTKYPLFDNLTLNFS